MDPVEIVACGGVVYDITTFAPRFPSPGESLVATKCIRGFGGKAANQCYMAKQMGARTGLIGKLGKDGFGAEFKTYLKENGVKDDHVTMTVDAQTSVGTIIVTESGQNCIAHVLGALTHLTVEDAVTAAEDLFVEGTRQVLLCSYECPRKPLEAILRKAKDKGLFTIVNAGPWCGEVYEEIYPLTDILCLNETEAELATSVKVQNVSNAEEASRFLTSRGCGTIIVTLGSQGAVLFNRGDAQGLHVTPPKVKAIDTSAAGDAFLGSLGFYICRFPELPMAEKMRCACAIAAITVQSEGTQASFPSLDKIPKELLQH